MPNNTSLIARESHESKRGHSAEMSSPWPTELKSAHKLTVLNPFAIRSSDCGAICSGLAVVLQPILLGILLFLTNQNRLLAEEARPAIDSDWPQWRGPRGDGSWHAPALAETWPTDGLRQLWQAEISGGYAGVIVASRRVLVMDRVVELETNSDDKTSAAIRLEQERLQCFDAESGQHLWSFSYDQTYGDLSYGTGPRAAPTVSDGLVYTFGTFGKLHCLNLANGRLLWSHDVMKHFGGRLPEWGFAASPQIYRDTVIVFAGGLQSRCLLAFDRRSGKLKWSSLNDQAGYSWPVVVSRPGFDLLVCWTPSHIRGVNAANGEPLWATPYEVTYGVSIATPVVHQDTILVCGYWHGSKAIRLGATATDATLQWEENKFLRGLMSQPLCRDGHVYLLDKQYGLTCF